MQGYYDYYDNMESFVAPSAAIGVVLGVFAVALVLTLLFTVAYYVLHSLGCYTIAKRRGIHHPWLAWIPVGNMWILGSIADQYQYVSKGKVRSRRKVLMGLTIAMYALMIPVYIVEIAMVVQSVMGYSDGYVGIAVMAVCAVALSVVTIVAAVFQYIAYYDLFSSCQPNNAVLYLVLSIIFGITLPIFVFICRNQDAGMPPRKQSQESPAKQLPEETNENFASDEDFEEPAQFPEE